MQGGDVFHDINGHEYFEEIMAFAGTGISTGTADGNYQPERATNRAHFAIFLERAIDIHN
ncbi:S-layer homology domain-containing protein [Geomicrobium sp. JCM 19038]|uniref:S-layer homology domain-containing protein n=1 Tax=Geomicrobium sp. JCM 19038 TaxID=1460635 RepID=UPI0005A79733|nr:S-layer homology domain-containing protein [Geomicrobium sp. JCM 19038]